MVLLSGCKPAEPPEIEPQEEVFAGVVLRMAVVDDAPLAKALLLARGEWEAQSGAVFDLVEISPAEAGEYDWSAVDVVLGAPHLAGILSRQASLAPVPSSLIATEEAGGWADLFELPRLQEAAWGAQIVGVPFGTPLLTCYFRSDLFEAIEESPPQTWADYQRIAERITDRENLPEGFRAPDAPWHAVAEPLGPGWAGITFLARGATYAKHRNRYATLFDIQTMDALLENPALVRALRELVEAARLGPEEQLTWGPADVRAAFWQGRCGLALTWPSGAEVAAPPVVDETVRAGIVELPAGREVFEPTRGEWQRRRPVEERRIPLLSASGRMGFVLGHCEHPEAAFQTLAWLSGVHAEGTIAARSPATTLYRRSHLARPQDWVEPPLPLSAALDYALLTQASMRRLEFLSVPRIPGREEYLAALDGAVHRAVAEGQPPAEALAQCAAAWDAITDRLGRSAQRAAYLASLGVEP